jgi:hypothetical protein
MVSKQTSSSRYRLFESALLQAGVLDVRDSPASCMKPAHLAGMLRELQQYKKGLAAEDFRTAGPLLNPYELAVP